MYQTLRPCLLAVLAIVAPAAGALGIDYASGNLHRVDASFYRSGQLTPTQLDDLIRTAGIRSILNLRGDHPGEDWWRDETLVAATNGVVHRSIALSSRHAPDLGTMDGIAAFMRDAPKPILVHCQAGADRSGLASALYQLAVVGADPEVADRQLSIRYGHFPWLGSRTHAMDDAFHAFVASRYPLSRSLKIGLLQGLAMIPGHVAIRRRHRRGAVPGRRQALGGRVLRLPRHTGHGRRLRLRPPEEMDPPRSRRLVTCVAAEAGWWEEVVGDHMRDRDRAKALFPGVGRDAGPLDAPAARLSTGERQRAALVRAVIGSPRFLLLDEPTSARRPGSTPVTPSSSPGSCWAP